MHIAVFAPFIQWPPHFGADLEIIQRHLDAGDRVTLLTCSGELATCDINLPHHAEGCERCIATRQAGIRLLSPSVEERPLLSGQALVPPPGGLRTTFAEREDLKGYVVDGFDIGYAALSSLIFYRRDADVDLVAHGELLAQLLRAAWEVYVGMLRVLATANVDRVYVFNTRFATTRGVLRACQRVGVECVAHERGFDLQHYEVYPNTFPHDRELTDRRIREAWASADPVQARDIGARWFREKAVGIETYQNSFVADQQPTLLPASWRSDQRALVIFTSSEDEFAAIGAGWENPLYRSELAGVESIVASLLERSHDWHVYVRVHPNLRGIDNRQTRGLAALDAPFLTVIPADSPVSTYALLQRASTVVTFGSTVGIEAVYWGVPSILAGMSWYRDLGATYNPATHDDLLAMLESPLAPHPIEPALMYGYFFATYGIPFRYFRATGFATGEFKGHNLWAT